MVTGVDDTGSGVSSSDWERERERIVKDTSMFSRRDEGECMAERKRRRGKNETVYRFGWVEL